MKRSWAWLRRCVRTIGVVSGLLAAVLLLLLPASAGAFSTAKVTVDEQYGGVPTRFTFEGITDPGAPLTELTLTFPEGFDLSKARTDALTLEGLTRVPVTPDVSISGQTVKLAFATPVAPESTVRCWSLPGPAFCRCAPTARRPDQTCGPGRSCGQLVRQRFDDIAVASGGPIEAQSSRVVPHANVAAGDPIVRSPRVARVAGAVGELFVCLGNDDVTAGGHLAHVHGGSRGVPIGHGVGQMRLQRSSIGARTVMVEIRDWSTIVVVDFTIDATGQAGKYHIVQDIGGSCGRAAVKAIGEMQFLPAVQNGYTVPCKIRVPIRFKLQ